MNFKLWLESEIRLGAIWNDGTVVFYIDGERHSYQFKYNEDLPKFRKLVKYRPWGALNYIKELISLDRVEHFVKS